MGEWTGGSINMKKWGLADVEVRGWKDEVKNGLQNKLGLKWVKSSH
jgi:hypothetical protein